MAKKVLTSNDVFYGDSLRQTLSSSPNLALSHLEKLYNQYLDGVSQVLTETPESPVKPPKKTDLSALERMLKL